MEILRIELADILRKHNFDEESSRLFERRIEDAIIEVSKVTEIKVKEHNMEHYLTRKESHEKDDAIVKAIYELRIEIANLRTDFRTESANLHTKIADLRTEMHQQTWKVVAILVSVGALLKFIPNLFQ